MQLDRKWKIECPACHETVCIYAEPKEKLDAHKPVKCPNCGRALNEAIVQQSESN